MPSVERVLSRETNLFLRIAGWCALAGLSAGAKAEPELNPAALARATFAAPLC